MRPTARSPSSVATAPLRYTGLAAGTGEGSNPTQGQPSQSKGDLRGPVPLTTNSPTHSPNPAVRELQQLNQQGTAQECLGGLVSLVIRFKGVKARQRLSTEFEAGEPGQPLSLTNRLYNYLALLEKCN